ncbi:DUF7537 family lipoprotein [Haloplanus natans]|uniref:DUF7537 family lipoprotein n=1 Tax=Haloplanus natans TaxID=376171 RepID=UPI0006779347|nr:hypothetical protein [Haloplanus natans]
MIRIGTALALAVLVVLAGCGGGAGPDGTATPTETATPTATPTQTSTPTATPASDGNGTFPGGWSETGVNDTGAALESHYRAVLTGPSATVQYRSRIVSAESDAAANTTLEMRLDTGGRRLSARIDGTERTREVFFADGTFRQWSVRNETVVGRSNTTFVRAAQSIDNAVLRSQLLTYRLELNETVTRGGTTALVYDVVGVHNDTLSGTYGTATAASGRVVVSDRGRVIDIRTTVTYTRGTVVYHYSQTRIGGTDVPTPEWLSAA